MRLIQLLSFPLKHTLVAYGCHKSPKLTISIYRPRCATHTQLNTPREEERTGGGVVELPPVVALDSLNNEAELSGHPGKEMEEGGEGL